MSFSNIECKGFPNSVTISNGKDLYHFETRDYVPLEALEEYVPLKAVEELIEKATPKKPKNWKAERRPNGRVEFNCPVCNRIYNERVNFCASCGQAIDWS